MEGLQLDEFEVESLETFEDESDYKISNFGVVPTDDEIKTEFDRDYHVGFPSSNLEDKKDIIQGIHKLALNCSDRYDHDKADEVVRTALFLASYSGKLNNSHVKAAFEANRDSLYTDLSDEINDPINELENTEIEFNGEYLS